MPVRQPQKKTYKSFQGKAVDMDTLRQRNELTPAVGNARVNARGDQLGAGGKIVRKREDVMRDYYNDNPTAAPDEVAQVEQPVEEVVPTETKAQRKAVDNAKKAKAVEAAAEDDEWVEDDDGNFVKRGE